MKFLGCGHTHQSGDLDVRLICLGLEQLRIETIITMVSKLESIFSSPKFRLVILL